MNYIGKRVFHASKYGKGTVIGQDENSHITVLFEAGNIEKKFIVPDCFKQHLELLDRDALITISKELLAKEAEETSKTEQRQQALQAAIYESRSGRSKTSRKDIPIPRYRSVEEFYAEQRSLLQKEILYLRENGGKRIKILDGKQVGVKGSRYIYSFESDSELNLPDNTQVSLWPSTASTSVPAIVVNCEEFTVIIASAYNLGASISVIEMSAEPWRLLNYLIDRIQTIQTNPSRIVKALVCDGEKNTRPGKELRKGQDTACVMSVEQPITFIWGPPGTGKTETLAKIALQHLALGKRVLMLSYSNVSVDGAIWRVFNKDSNKKPGRLIRFGYARDKELLQHEYLTSYNLAIMKHPDLLAERAKLTRERKTLSRTELRYVEIGDRLIQIKNQLDAEEKLAVKRSRFVATTVSKAIADKTIYEDKYDTVIFDEASMAYIPQIVFSASLAKEHFICMGDFSQLPPIVQSDNASCLNVDIFKYCGIVDAVESGSGHEWLCMLNTQYRMHPDIANFASTTMYHGLLSTGKDVSVQRKSILKSLPFPNDALRLVDLSGMYSVCVKTADQSRINVLSSMISMGLAIKAAGNNDVGVITPYNAQSRLLHAMSRDIAENAPQIHPINCATVHQFQGSEKDVILYDAVDCYRMQFPGTLLSSMTNNYANRLYNVAVTRARGKMISIVNVDYMRAKGFSRGLIFREMIDSLALEKKVTRGPAICNSVVSPFFSSYDLENAHQIFLEDISKSKLEIRIDIPGGTSDSPRWLRQLSTCLSKAAARGVKIFVRFDNKDKVNDEIQEFAIEYKYVTNPIAVIDKRIVWYGMPLSNANFISDGKEIPTQYRPIFRFAGKHFAHSLIGFLEMNRTIDTGGAKKSNTGKVVYNTFASYVAGEVKCSACGNSMVLKKSKKGRFFIGCSGYPGCDNSQLVDADVVDRYLYHDNKNGKRCPQDSTSLEPKMGPYGLYVCCCGVTRHYFKFDQF